MKPQTPMRIALHGRKFTAETIPYIQEVISILKSRGIEIGVSLLFKKNAQKSGLDLHEFPIFRKVDPFTGFDAIISLGGDGTLLETLTYVKNSETPIMGINTGRLGFLANISKMDIGKALDSFFEGRFVYDNRSLLRLDTNKDLFGDVNFALNEFTIIKKDTSSMITVKCYINGEYLNSYWADGLMISTPTGSTGYSLSCGGPVILPHSNNFVITPVSPHNLNVRPLIVPDASIISFVIESRGRNFLASLDSRSHTVDSSVKMSVRLEDFKARLIQLEGYTFLDTLRNKLNWGFDLRN